MIEKRPLGRSGISIAPLMFGGNVFGWTVEQKTCNALLDAFVDEGYDAIDTADSYSTWVPGHVGGESETMIGNWIKTNGRRDRVMLATKLASPMGEGRKGLSRAYVAQAVEASLKRLQTDRIDLYQAHRDDLSVPFEETLEAFSRLIQAGKVRAIGTSNQTGARLAEALKVSKDHNLPRYDTVQPAYSLVNREEYENDLEDLCRREGLGVIPHSTLAGGFLTGKYRKPEDFKGGQRGPRVEKYLTERGARVLAALDKVAVDLRAKQGQVALAWTLTNDSITAPIASATTLVQLQELFGAMRLKLSADAVKMLNDASA